MLVNKLRDDEELDDKVTDDEVQQIVKEAVEMETEFLTDALPVGDLGMNAGLMSKYIRFVADRLLTELKVPKIWNLENPFGFMEQTLNGRQD